MVKSVNLVLQDMKQEVMMNYHYHLLINQEAGSGNGKKVAELILPLLKNKKQTYTAYYSEYPGNEQEIALELAETTLLPWNDKTIENIDTFPILIVIGGDGTLNQVLNTFYHLNVEFPIAYIPAGSGNDFARGVGLPRNPEQALQKILDATEPKSINVITYEEGVQEKTGVVLNNLGIGLDAAIVYATNHSSTKSVLNKYNLGSFAYIFSILRVLFTQKSFPITVDINGSKYNYKKAFLCTTTNHPYFGGGVPIVPTADPYQPTIDLAVVDAINPFKLIWLIVLILRKKQLTSRYFHHFTTSKLQIVSPIPQHMQTDGEESEKNSFDLKFATKKQLFWFE